MLGRSKKVNNGRLGGNLDERITFKSTVDWFVRWSPSVTCGK